MNQLMRISALVGCSALIVAACGESADDTAAATSTTGEVTTTTPPKPVPVDGPRLVATFDGGLFVLDSTTLEVVEEIPMEGFLRVNPAGDDRHVFISTEDAFVAFDTGVEAEGHGDHAHYFGVPPRVTDIEFAADHPGHVVIHDGVTALFADGTGIVEQFDPIGLENGAPEITTYQAAEAHHGVAVPLADGGLLVTIGNEESRSGAIVVDAAGAETARTEACPGVHGETAAPNEVFVLGCEDGVVVLKNGTFTKVQAPDVYGRTGNVRGSAVSPVVLGDYKVDADAELERPTRINLINTDTATSQLVDIGTSYSFRSLGRGPAGEALVLGYDGAIHVIDPLTGAVVRNIPAVTPWEEPLDWQVARPTLMTVGATAYVTDPADKTITAINLNTGETTATVTLPHIPNELTGTGH